MAYTANHLKSKLAVNQVVDTTGGTSHDASSTWLPMGRRALIGATFVSGTALTGFSIYAGTDSTGAGGTLVATNNGATSPNAAGDTGWIGLTPAQARGDLTTGT